MYVCALCVLSLFAYFCCNFELDGITISKASENIKLCGWKIAIMNNSTTVNCKWSSSSCCSCFAIVRPRWRPTDCGCVALCQSCISKPTCVRFTLQIVLQLRCKIEFENSHLFSLNLICRAALFCIRWDYPNDADVQTANSVLLPLFFFFSDSAIKLWNVAPLQRLDNTKPIKTDKAFEADVSLVFLDNCHFTGSVPDWVGFITGVSERHLGNN